MLDRTTQRAFIEGSTVSQMVASYLLQSSIKTSIGKSHPVRRSRRSETKKMGMYLALAVVTIPVVPCAKGTFDASSLADLRIA